MSLYGTDLHPDLWRIQTAIGSHVSYQKGEFLLDQMCGQRRGANNDVRIQRLTQALGTEISDWDEGISESLSVPAAKELYMHVDGGHVSHREREKRSFEAMIGIIYKADAVKRIDKNHCAILDKRCVASCLDDHQEKIKAYIKKAALEQGMTPDTHITAFADGAKNCWSVIESLKPYCAQITSILDWFHVGKKFQPLLNSLTDKPKEGLEHIKWLVWHHQLKEAFTRLLGLKEQIKEEAVQSKIDSLYTYLKNNEKYLVSYAERHEKGFPVSSHAAESMVENLINDRQTKDGKMLWTREGAHHVLQIRAAIESGQWDTLYPIFFNNTLIHKLQNKQALKSSIN